MLTDVVYLNHRCLVVISFFIGSFLWESLQANEGTANQIEHTFLIPQIVESITENNPLAIHKNNAFSLMVQATKSYEKGDIREIIFAEFKNLKDFVNTLATKENYAFLLMRMVAKEIATSSFKHFRIDFIPTAEGLKLVFSNTSSLAEGIDIYAPYEKSAALGFEEYLKNQSNSAIFKSSIHTVSFPSISGNMLVVPKGNYVNFYDFALNASAEEILDFWKHVSTLIEEFKADQFDLASHAGSHAGQTVFHFHLRFEFHDKETKNRIKKLGNNN